MRWPEPVLHVDMDAFFVEVERMERPELVGVPVVVGGGSPRGVVAAASYEARAFGVESAMPMATARRRCSELIVVPPRHGLYRQISERVFAIFAGFTPLVEGLSLDEAFLDVGGLWRHHPSANHVGEAVRQEIRHELGLPASVGIASNKLIAKLASQAAKPDGLLHVPVADQLRFLHALPVGALWGVGEATMAALEVLGAETVGDVARVPAAVLERRLGSAHGSQLARLAAGLDPRPVMPEAEAKSLSSEETYRTDLHGSSLVDVELLAHSDAVASRLRRAGLVARTVTVKIRFGDFETVTRSRTVDPPVDVAHHIHDIARDLVATIALDRGVRLVGLVAGKLEPADAPRQLAMEAGEDWENVSGAIDAIRARFGESSIEPARLLGRRRDHT